MKVPARILDGEKIANEIKEGLKKDLAELKEKYGAVPNLISIQVGENPAIAVYARQQQKSCESLGINYELRKLPEETTEEDLIRLIEQLNEDKNVTGILLQLPVPKQIDARKVQGTISPIKDVEGVHPANMGTLVYGRPRLAPCTAAAAVELIMHTGVDLYGKEVCMVGHSDIVGKPIALLLLDKFATTTVCHIATQDLPFHTKRADILIVAVGKPNLITADMIKEGAIVIDIGINRVKVLDSQGKEVLDEKGKPKMKTIGDVEYDKAVEKASWITPVPGGVGPMTVTMLLKNTVQAAKWQLEG